MTYLSKDKNFFFEGDGSINDAGESLAEFLDKYDPRDYMNPSSTVDMAVFTHNGDKKDLKILLIKRRNHPSIGQWAIPGGFVEFDEDIDAAAKRELEEETGVTDIVPAQVRTYGMPDRDPRTRIITTLYAGLVNESCINPVAGDDAGDAALFDISLSNMGNDIIRLELYCKERDIRALADLRRNVITGGIVPEVRHEIVNTEGIALDHAILITDAYLFLLNSI